MSIKDFLCERKNEMKFSTCLDTKIYVIISSGYDRSRSIMNMQCDRFGS